MKRYIKKTIILSVAGALSFSCDSSNKTVDDVFEGVTRGAVFRAVSPATVVAAQEFSFSDPSSTYEVTFEVEDNAEGGLLQEVGVYSAFTDTSDDAGSVKEVLVETLDPSMFTVNERGLPQITYSITLDELSSALGLATEDYTGGDSFTIRYEIVLTDGRTFSNGNLNSTVSGGSYYRSPFIYTVPLVCPPVAPITGEWSMDFQDAFGDGWNGASIIVSIDGTETPYTIEAGAAASYNFQVPESTEELVFTYVSGEWDEEVSFQIISSAGNVKADVGPSPVAGPIALNYCVD